VENTAGEYLQTIIPGIVDAVGEVAHWHPGKGFLGREGTFSEDALSVSACMYLSGQGLSDCRGLQDWRPWFWRQAVSQAD
jgi:hypothetical protein